MRIVTWNCGVGGFRKKAARMAALQPYVLVVQEVEKLDGELFLDRERQPTYLWRTPVGGSILGLAVLSYSAVELRPAFDEAHPLDGFYPFEATWGELEFHVAGVWTFASRSRPMGRPFWPERSRIGLPSIAGSRKRTPDSASSLKPSGLAR